MLQRGRRGAESPKSGKLKEARAAFTRCAQAGCPAEVTDRCTGWIADVDDAMPSIIVSAQDGLGHDLASGTVHVDDEQQSVLAGQTLLLEPGPHTLVLDVPGKPRVTETVVLKEHEKNRRVLLALPVVASVELPKKKPSVAPFVLGGVGLFFGAVFGGFAIAAVVDRQSSGCDTGCAAPAYGRVRAELVTADASLGLAAAFVIAAIIDFAVTRSEPKRTIAHIPLGFAF